MNKELIEQGVSLILQGFGVDEQDSAFDGTPARVAKAYEEIFRPKATNWPLFHESYSDMVLVKSIRFYSLCPHHLLPVELCADIAYIPHGKVTGLSKVIRVVRAVNSIPKLQEKLTEDIAVELMDRVKTYDVAIVLEGKHGCMQMRGVHARESSTVTTKFTGVFATEPAWEQRFMQLRG